MHARLLLGSALLLVVGTGCPRVYYDDDVPPIADDDDDVCFDCFGDGDVDVDADVDGDADVDADADADQRGNLAEFCEAFVMAMCDGNAACCDDGWTEDATLTCFAQASQYCDLVYGDEVRAGRLAIRLEALWECFGELQERISSECPVSGPAAVVGPDACAFVFEPRVAPFGPCVAGFECIGGLDCVFEDWLASFGICSVAPSEGQRCGWTCQPGLACVDGYCERPHGLRSRCTVAPDGGSDDCADGLYCDGTGVCVGRLSDGAACDSSRACFGDCIDGTCRYEPYDYCWAQG